MSPSFELLFTLSVLWSPHVHCSPLHQALLMALEPLMDAGRGADVEELEGIAAASFTAARVGEAASQVAHDLQLLVQVTGPLRLDVG